MFNFDDDDDAVLGNTVAPSRKGKSKGRGVAKGKSKKGNSNAPDLPMDLSIEGLGGDDWMKLL